MKLHVGSVVFLLGAAACVSEKPATKSEVVAAPVKSAEDAKAADRDARFARSLIEIDQRADRYAALGAQPGDEARGERNLLGSALASQVGEFRTELIEMAGDESNSVRRAIAVKALAFCDDRSAVAPLVKALAVKGDPRLLTSATYALARLHDASTPTRPLLELVKDADTDVRSNALLALARVFDAKRELGANALDPIEQHEAAPILEAAMFDPADPLVRAHAAAAAGALGDPRAVDPLLNLLRDEHPLVRTRTAIALGKLGDAKAIPALVKAIDSSPAGTTRKSVITALAKLLEDLGHRPPENMGDDGRAWERFVREAMGAPPK